MAVPDWSTTAASNTTIDGINIAEGCPAANMNGMGRAIMASVRVMYDAIPVTSALMPKAGGIFTGAISYTARGGYVHFNDSSNTSGRIFVQASGGAAPSMSNGDLLLEY
jgi:hypothetical protein